MPKWYIADLAGEPLAAGYIKTWSSLNHAVAKFAYQDANGSTPWPATIIFDANGSEGPFYWEVNPDDPTDKYFLQVYDVNNVLQWTIDNYGPVPDVGGGTTTTDGLENLVINNVMINNFNTSANPITSTSFKIAPGVHDGLADTSSLMGPDIWFIKNNTAATDVLEFVNFTLGADDLSPDVTPQQFLRYTCGNSPVGETYKYVQFPITKNVQNLSGMVVSYSVWARATSGATGIQIIPVQFFGDGGTPSTTVVTPAQSKTLTSGWAKYTGSFTMPDVTGKALGTCRNDGVFLRFAFPLGLATVIEFTKLSFYVGANVATTDFQNNDMILSVTNSPRTGDYRTSLNDFYYFGWVPANNGSIGNTGSSATTRADIATFPLFNLIYRNVLDFWAPVSGGRTGNAVDDFASGKRLTLTKALGRILSGQTLTASTITATGAGGAPNYNLTVSSTSAFLAGDPVQLTGITGLSNLAINTVYFLIINSATTLRLTTNIEDAEGTANPIDLGTAGDCTIQHALGASTGASRQTLVANNVPIFSADFPTTAALNGVGVAIQGVGGAGVTNLTITPNDPGGPGASFTVVNPQIMINVYIKL